MKQTQLLISLFASALFSFSAFAVEPAQVNVTVYQLWASLNADCSDPIKVIDNGATGRTSNIVTGPDLGEGTLPPDGTYNCLIMVIKDNVQIVPATTGTIPVGACDQSSIATALNCGDADCVAGQAYDQITCNNMAQADPLPDGTAAECDGTGGKVAAFFSTTGSQSADGHKASAAKKLSTPIVVAGGSTSVTFSMYDPVGLKSESAGMCGQTQHASMEIKQ